MSADTIITHDGRFHADEVLACVILKKIYPNATIKRTRDISMINNYINANLVIAIVDVYGQYNPDKYYFDHHQRGFDTYINGVKCSSAGLVLKHLGSDILKAYGIQTGNKSRILKDIYTKYFRTVDAIDNGVTINCHVDAENVRNSVEHDLGFNGICKSTDTKSVCMRTISNMVAECETFEEAFTLVDNDFSNFMNSIHQWTLKFDKVRDLLRNMGNNTVVMERYRKSILLTEEMDNIGKIVCEIEGELIMDVKYVIDKKDGRYRIFAVPSKIKGCSSKKPLLKKWRGLADEELSKSCGISGCVFVHATGFLGINLTLQGALDMCYVSLE